MIQPMPQNLMQRFFQILIYVLTGIGFSMLALAAQISAPVFLLFILLFVPAVHPRFSARFRLSYRQGNFLTWAYLPLFLLDTFVISGSFVTATLHLILFVQLVKIHQPKKDRDYFYLMILSFLEVLAASSLTIGLSFLILFVAYLFVSLAALMAFEMKRSSDTARQTFDQRSGAPPADDSSSEGRQAVRSIGMISAVSVLTVFVIGSVLFFAIPRFGAGYFHRAARGPSTLSGFSDNIRLGGIGAIQLNPAVVMRVRVFGDANPLKQAKWRGVTLDYFDGRSWSKRARGPAINYPPDREYTLNAPRTSGVQVKYQVLMEPTSTTYLFTLNQIVRLRGALSPVTKDPFDDSVTARSHPFRRLSYYAESFLPIRGQAPTGDTRELSWPEAQAYLQLPSLDPRIFELARTISTGANQIEDKALSIERYLRTNFSYSLDSSELASPQPLTRFILNSRRGHCEYFASAMVVLLRTLRIPARIVNGFQSGEYNEVAEDYIIRGRDAHSWVEVLVPDIGWLPFDPTPSAATSQSQIPIFRTLSNYLDAFELFWAEWVVGYDDSIQISLFHDLQEKTAHWKQEGQHRFYSWALEVSKWLRSLPSVAKHVRPLPFWPILTTLSGLLAAAFLLSRVLRQARLHLSFKRSTADPGQLAIRFYEECLRVLAAQGRVKPPSFTASEFAATFQTDSVGSLVLELTRIYNQTRFGRDPIAEPQIRKGFLLLKELQVHYKKHKLRH
jgi:transglutaminase-like putative cysteine protease